MTRTAKYKALYLAIRIGVPPALLGVTILIDRFWRLSPFVPLVLVGLAIVMLRPRLVRHFFWKDLVVGRRLLRQEDYVASKRVYERFIARMRKAPWLKNLIWLGITSRSADPEALALKNLAIDEMNLDAPEAARQHLVEAIALDPENPLLFYYMGIVCVRVGPWLDAKPWLEKAAALGLNSGWSDKIIRAAQSQSQFQSQSAGGPIAGDYRVEVLNDDVTPMDFVEELLEQVFDLSAPEAAGIMLTVHHQGSAAFGRYDETEAMERVSKAIARARAANFPLSLRVAADMPA